MISTASIFAGQGAQAVGMGKDVEAAFPSCKALFTKASEVLGYDLAKTCFEGPAELLTKTSVCQPAIFVVSACCFAALRERKPTFAFAAAAGLSLGEWTALYAAEVVSFEQAVRILEARGRFMQEACDESPSGMITILKAPMDKVQEIAEKTGLSIANINSADQVVYSGTKDAIAAAEAEAKAAGARPVVLQVAGGYHSRFMASAATKLEAFLANETFKSPAIPVYSNVTGKPHGNSSDEIRKAMVAQVTGTVRWMDVVSNMAAAGMTRFVEFGPGKTLSGLVKKIRPEAAVANVADMATLETVEV